MDVSKPFPYYGAKDWLVPTLLEFICEHKVYIERFLGSGALFCAKPLAEVSILNDLDKGVYNFWVILKDFTKYREDIEKISYWQLFEDIGDFNKKEKKKLFRILKNEAKYYKIEKVPDIKGFFFFFVKQFYGYDSVSWYPSEKFFEAEEINIKKYFDRWIALEKKLNLKEVRIMNEDFRNVVPKEFDNEQTLIYDDPPYIRALERKYYNKAEVTPEEVAINLKELKCKWIVSYNNSRRVLDAFKNYKTKLIKAPYKSKIEWELLIINT